MTGLKRFCLLNKKIGSWKLSKNVCNIKNVQVFKNNALNEKCSGVEPISYTVSVIYRVPHTETNTGNQPTHINFSKPLMLAIKNTKQKDYDPDVFSNSRLMLCTFLFGDSYFPGHFRKGFAIR